MIIIKNINRDSNIELLRIVAMTMIILSHCILHGIPFLSLKGNDILNPSLSNIEYLIFAFFESLFIYGVNVFILISGFYSIKPNFRNFFNLYLLICCYNIVNLLLMYIKGFHIYVINILHSFMLLSHPHSWFISQYFILFFISPLLNIFSKNTSKIIYIYILIIFLFLMCYCGFIKNLYPFTNGYNIWQFILLYLIGRYLHKYVDKERSPRLFFLVFLLCAIIIFVSFSISLKLRYICHDESLPMHVFWYDNPFILLGSVSLFILFRRFSYNNKYINWISCSMLSVYLVQEGSELVFKRYLYEMISYSYSHNNIVIFLSFLVMYLIVLFLFSVIFDKILRMLIDFIYRRIIVLRCLIQSKFL